MKNFQEKAGFIWSVADLLRGDYKQSDYGKVILPLTVLRRLDCVLEPTKEKVLERAKALPPKADEKMRELMLWQAAGPGMTFHIPYAAMSETSSNCWKLSVINEASCSEYLVDTPSRTSWMAA